jgi:hypothetical protein
MWTLSYARAQQYAPSWCSLPRGCAVMLVMLSVEPSVLAYAERTGFLVLGASDRLMEVRMRNVFSGAISAAT